MVCHLVNESFYQERAQRGPKNDTSEKSAWEDNTMVGPCWSNTTLILSSTEPSKTLTPLHKNLLSWQQEKRDVSHQYHHPHSQITRTLNCWPFFRMHAQETVK